MRLLLLITDLHRGGTPGVVASLAPRLAAAGVTVHVCALGRGELARDLGAAGAPCTLLGARGAWDVAVLPRLLRAVDAFKPDVVLSFLVHANMAAAWTKRRRPNIRAIMSVRTTQPLPRWHWWAQRVASRSADAIVVPSPDVEACLGVHRALGRARCVTIANGVDDRFAAITGRPDRRRLLFLGRLDPVKRVADILDALVRLPSDFTLDICGDGPERARLEFRARSLGLSGRARFHGMVADSAAALTDAGTLVLPSQAEGSPNCIIEAMAAGRPVVAADVRGIASLVESGITGLLYPCGDVDSLARALAQLAGDTGLADSLATRARAVALDRHAWSNILPRYLELFAATVA